MAKQAQKPPPPSAAALAKELGPSQSLWDELRQDIARDFAPIAEDWVYSGQKHGWALRLKRRDRAVLYLKPLEGHFRASLALGARAVQAARDSKLPAQLLQIIDEAVQYPEGKGIRIEIRARKDVRIASQLAAIKMAT